jgi:hypothetical protein
MKAAEIALDSVVPYNFFLSIRLFIFGNSTAKGRTVGPLERIGRILSDRGRTIGTRPGAYVRTLIIRKGHEPGPLHPDPSDNLPLSL